MPTKLKSSTTRRACPTFRDQAAWTGRVIWSNGSSDNKLKGFKAGFAMASPCHTIIIYYHLQIRHESSSVPTPPWLTPEHPACWTACAGNRTAGQNGRGGCGATRRGANAFSNGSSAVKGARWRAKQASDQCDSAQQNLVRTTKRILLLPEKP